MSVVYTDVATIESVVGVKRLILPTKSLNVLKSVSVDTWLVTVFNEYILATSYQYIKLDISNDDRDL